MLLDDWKETAGDKITISSGCTTEMTKMSLSDTKLGTKMGLWLLIQLLYNSGTHTANATSNTATASTTLTAATMATRATNTATMSTTATTVPVQSESIYLAKKMAFESLCYGY